jgi:HB1/ASXL restriction endonuclease-like protein with HTH domain
MDVRNELEQAIAQHIRTPSDANRVREAADLLADYLVLEQRVQDLIHKPAADGPIEGGLRGMTLHDAAERALEEAGVPLHVRELGARIKAGGWKHPRSSNARPERIFFQLAARLPQHPERFRRVAPNTFALTKWGDDGAERKAPRPRKALFQGPGRAIGRMTGESDEPVEAGEAAWRSS